MNLGNLNDWANLCHTGNDLWWKDLETGEKINRNKGEMIALMHSELSECLEGERKDLMDSHLPHRRMAEVELADLFIRMMDYCGAYDYDIHGAVVEKREYNKHRLDHTYEERLKPNGKKF